MKSLRIVTVVACCGYWLLLTALLLVSNPAAMVGLKEVPVFPWGKFGVHLIAFLVLAFLIHAAQWPNRLCWPLILVLAAYGITTESLQLLVPQRTARVMDAVENVLGISIASAIYWLVQRCWGRLSQEKRGYPTGQEFLGTGDAVAVPEAEQAS